MRSNFNRLRLCQRLSWGFAAFVLVRWPIPKTGWLVAQGSPPRAPARRPDATDVLAPAPGGHIRVRCSD